MFTRIEIEALKVARVAALAKAAAEACCPYCDHGTGDVFACTCAPVTEEAPAPYFSHDAAEALAAALEAGELDEAWLTRLMLAAGEDVRRHVEGAASTIPAGAP